MIIGYAKVQAPASPATLDEIRAELRNAGAELVFIDCASTWNANHPAHGVDTAIAECAQGDTLLTLTPAHLTQSLASLIAIANRLTAQGAALRVMQVAGGQMLDTGTPAGAMMLGALGLMAAFEAPSRGAEPVAAPMQRRPRGRPATASTQADEIARLRANGMSAVEIASRLNICRASVYRVLTLSAPAPEAAPRVAMQVPAARGFAMAN
jgi:DNA invertase Pin-like site-specific DNA recombinase